MISDELIFIWDFNYLYITICFIFILVLSSLFLYKKNYIMLLICFELLITCLVVYLVYLSIIFNDLTGQVFGLIILTVSAAESALILSLITLYFKIKD